MPASTPSTTALPTPTPTPTFSSTPKAAVPPASAVGSVFTHTRPTSRGRVCCVSFRLGRGRALTAAGPRAGACRLRGRWATLPCPGGQGALPVCRGDAVCPAGKGAAEWRAGSWRVAGESGFFGAVCPSGKFTSAPGNGGTGRTPQGTEIHAISQTERAFSRQNLPHHPTAANAALYKARLIARRGKPPRYAPKTSVPRLFTPHPRLFTTHPRLFTTHPRLFTTHPRLFTTHPRLFTTHPAPLTAFQRLFADILHLLRHPAPAKVSFPPFPPPPHLPDHPAGRTAGSARTRSRGQLRLSF